MALKRKPYFSDNQIKRMLVQLLACFSGYQVQTGIQKDGKTRFLDVPIIYGDLSRTVGFILRGGSRNNMQTIPAMSLYMTGLRQAADRRQAPKHFERKSYVEVAKTADGQIIPGKPGRPRVVERYMPVPYEMRFEVRIWSSNNDQGYQLIEQICTVFNPDADVMLRNSPADWTWIRTIFFGGEVTFERVVPSGTEADRLYVFKLPFKVIVWIRPPAKTYDLKPILTIEVPIYEIEADLDFDRYPQLDGLVIRAFEHADDLTGLQFELFGVQAHAQTPSP